MARIQVAGTGNRAERYRSRYRSSQMDRAGMVPRSVKHIGPPKLKKVKPVVMGGGLPAPGNIMVGLGRAWMDRGRTVTPGRGVVGADRSMLQGTLAMASDRITSAARQFGLIRRPAKRGGRLPKR